MSSGPPNPYQAGDYCLVAAPQGATQTSIPQTIGILNIIFGALLLMCGLCSGVSQFASSAFLGPLMQAQQQQLQAQLQAQQDRMIQQLKDQEANAPDEATRQQIAQERQRLEQQPLQQAPDFTALMGIGQSMAWYTWLSLGTSVPLNILLIIAGAGLLRRQEWGRKLCLWTAGSKVVRLLIDQGLWIFVVVPDLAQTIGDAMTKMMPPNAQGPPPGAMTGVYLVVYSVQGVLTILFGSIYPLISLYLLSRPRVREACQGAGMSAPSAAVQ